MSRNVSSVSVAICGGAGEHCQSHGKGSAGAGSAVCWPGNGACRWRWEKFAVHKGEGVHWVWGVSDLFCEAIMFGLWTLSVSLIMQASAPHKAL